MTVPRAGILAGLFVAMCVGCAQPYFAGPPAECRLLEIVVGDRGELHSVAGLYFVAANCSDREISGLAVEFSLYGEAGTPIPGFGTNAFSAGVTTPIQPGQVVALCTSLDDFLTAPVAELSVNRFRLTSVTYADGGTWRSPTGVLLRETDR